MSALPCLVLPRLDFIKDCILSLSSSPCFLVPPRCVHCDRRPDQYSKRHPFTSFCFFVFESFFVFLFVPRGMSRGLSVGVRRDCRECSESAQSSPPPATPQSSLPAAHQSSLPAVRLSSPPAVAIPSLPAAHQSSSQATPKSSSRAAARSSLLAVAPPSPPAILKSSPPAAPTPSPPAVAPFSSKVRSSVLTKGPVQAPAPDQSQVMSPEVLSTGTVLI